MTVLYFSIFTLFLIFNYGSNQNFIVCCPILIIFSPLCSIQLEQLLSVIKIKCTVRFDVALRCSKLPVYPIMQLFLKTEKVTKYLDKLLIAISINHHKRSESFIEICIT